MFSSKPSGILCQHPEINMRKEKIFTQSENMRKTKIVCTIG